MSNSAQELKERLDAFGTAMREFAASVNSYTQHPSFQPALDIVAGGPVNMPADAPEWAQQAGMAVNHLLREVGALRAELRAAQLKIKYLDACSIVRAQNSRALRAEHELERLPTLPALAAAPAKAEAPLPALGDAPASFPTTVGALRDLEDESFEGSAELDALLEAYGLAVDGTAKERRDRFAKHIGCVL